ncbi:tetratricopeptide repeat protein [Nocardia sp. KC 131]|uniref:tetratricopeptide repeat protein n=1 Tax=Nocardia arseniciresistens TaxID=3392119 RepID=UPI00398E3102
MTALERAEVAAELGRLDEARHIVGVALVAAPNNPMLLERMADLEYRLGHTEDALRMAGWAIATDPNRYDAHLTLAMAYEARGKNASALRYARAAMALEPDRVSSLLTLAMVISGAPVKSAPLRAEARHALEAAARQAPGHAGTHAYIANVYRRLGDREAAEKHLDAGLAADPTHSDLLAEKAKLAISRRSAVRILRGVLGSRPGHDEARQQLAAITWRALLRLAAWLWFYAIGVAIGSMWIGPGVLRLLSLALFVIVPVAWTRVFRVLRKQLPRGYLRQRLRRPAAVLALVVLVLATVIADLGTIIVRLDWTADSVRGGYILLEAGVIGAALAHLLFFGAWLRRTGGEEDREASYDYAVGGVAIVLAVGTVTMGLLAALRHWSRQPAALWVVIAIVSIIGATLVIEMLMAVLLEKAQFRIRWIMLIAVPLLALAACGTWWGTDHMVTRTFHSEERLNLPKTPQFPPLRPLPPIPTFRVTIPPLPTSPPDAPDRAGG